MNLFLQFGYGMIGHCDDLLSSGVGSGVILSPRDLDLAQLGKVAVKSKQVGAQVLFDPQCYARDADHQRLTNHNYWKEFKKTSTNSVLTGSGAKEIIKSLYDLNKALGTDALILPAVMAESVTPDWLAFHRNLAKEASQSVTDRPVYATIALSNDACADEIQIEAVVEEIGEWPVAGCYIIAQAPNYLVENPNWLANLLILSAGLKLLGKRIVVGYANHQLLSLGVANVDSIASGTWLNVRAFDPSKFYIPEEDEISRRTKWYYCPQSLSEYKIPFLDTARRSGILDSMKPIPPCPSVHCSPLFSGAAPTSVQWEERSMFRHYLATLNWQVGNVRKATFVETFDSYRKSLDEAEAVLKTLRGKGVLGGDRDFSKILDTNRSALTLLDNARGPQLKKSW